MGRIEFVPDTVLWLGRFHQPASAWNTEHHHGQYLQTDITRPYIERWEDEQGIIPQHITGLLLESRQSIGKDGAIQFYGGIGAAPALTNGALDAIDLLGNGYQVAVSVAYLETAALLASALEARRWRIGRITGEMSAAENEATRIDFQSGRIDVVAFTATESISLHEGELPGGTAPRALVAHDLRYSAIQMAQIEGRCHRNGRAATIWYAFAEETIEEQIAATVIARMLAMDSMAGDDTALLAAIADVIEAAAEERAA